MVREIGKIKFQRAVVPEDAINLDIQTVDAADASQKLAFVAIYARFLKKMVLIHVSSYSLDQN